MPPRRTLMLAFAGALLQALSYAPFHFVIGSLATIGFLHVATDGLDYRKVFTTGWWAGFVCHMLIYWWLIDTVVVFGNLPVAVGILAYVLFSLGMGVNFALTTLIATALMRKVKLKPVEAWPVAYVAVYLFMPQLFPFYLGVEWYVLKSPLRLNPPDIRIVSAMIAMAGAFGGDWYLRRRQVVENPVRVAAWALVFAVMFIFSWPRDLPAKPKILRVAIAQADFPLHYALRQSDTVNRFQKFVDQYREGVEKGAELVVFSESTLPFPYLVDGQETPEGRSYGRRMTDKLNEIVLEAKVPLIASGAGFEGDRISNRSFFIEPTTDGKIRNQVYDKRRLLWFGEYVPYRNYWPMHEQLFAGVSQFDPGPGPVLWTWNNLTLLPSICYEAILPYFTRSIIPAGRKVDLIVNMTIDKWFGLTNEQEQHLMLATWRSAETGIPMIRATLNGISAVVDGRGETIMRTEKGKSGVWLTDVPLNSPAEAVPPQPSAGP